MLSIKRYHTLAITTVCILAATFAGCAKQGGKDSAKILFVAGKMSHGFNAHEYLGYHKTS